MNIQKIDSTNFGAKLRFQTQQRMPKTAIKRDYSMLYKYKQSFAIAIKTSLALPFAYQIIKRIKDIKNSVKFPD